MRLGGAGGRLNLSGGSIRRAESDVLEHRAVKEEDILADIAKDAAQAGAGGLAHVLTVDGHAARAHVIEPQEEPQNGGLARSGGSDNGVGFAGGDADGDSLQDVRPAAIAKGDVLQRDFAAHPGGQGGGAVLHRRLGVHEAKNAPRGGHGPLEEVKGFTEAGHGPQQALGHEDQHRKDRDFQLAVQGHPPAHEQGAGEARQDAHANERHKGGGKADGVSVGLAVVVAHPLDAPGLGLFGGEGLDGGDAAQVRRQRSAQLRDGLAHARIARKEPLLVPHAAPHDEGDRQHGQQGDEPRAGRKDRAHQHDVPKDIEDGRRAVVEEPFELVNVVVDDRQQPAGAGVFEVRHVQALHMAVETGADFVLDGLAEIAPTQSGKVSKERFKEPNEGIQHHQRKNLLPAVLDAERGGDKRILPPHHHIDGHADDDLRHHVHHLGQRGPGGGEDHLAAMRPRVAPEPAESGVCRWHGSDGGMAPVNRLGFAA